MKKNHIAYVLDRSSSMASIWDATIKSFNEQFEGIKVNSRGQIVDISLFTFSTQPDPPTLFAASLDSVQELNRSNYIPNGNTALYDAVLEATRMLGNLADANDPDTSFLVIIQSDGEENCSSAQGSDVSARLEALQSTGRWTFTYLGCSQGDLTRMRALGISSGNSRSFAYSADGMTSTSALNCSATSGYFAARAAGASSVANFYDSVDAQPNEQADPNSGLILTPGISGAVAGNGVLFVNTGGNLSVSLPSSTNISISSTGSTDSTTDKKDETNPPATT